MPLEFTLDFFDTAELTHRESKPKRTRPNKGKSLLSFPRDYVVIDLETTGLSPMYDEIIECSAIRVVGGAIVDTFSALVKPTGRIEPHIVELTGITNEMVSTADGIATVLPRYLDFIGRSIVVAHNANFDVNFLYDAAERLNCTFHNSFVDTMRLSKALCTELPNHKLATLSAFLQVENTQAHRALSDCYCTNTCYIKMGQMEQALSADDCSVAPTQKSGHTRQPAYKTVAPKSVIPCTNCFDESHPFYNKSIVFTGELSIERKEAMQLVVDAGAVVRSGVSSKTDYLVVGKQDDALVGDDHMSGKEEKAYELLRLGKAHVQILTEREFFSMLHPEVAFV